MKKLQTLESFLSLLFRTVKIIDTPPDEEAVESEAAIRDVDDRPILRAAIKSNADILLTGDKDFLESTITNPKIMTAAQFIEMEV